MNYYEVDGKLIKASSVSAAVGIRLRDREREKGQLLRLTRKEYFPFSPVMFISVQRISEEKFRELKTELEAKA